MTVGQLSQLLSFARSSSVHTRPTQTSDKANKKLAERLTAFNTVHLNVFLRCYVFGCAAISSAAMAELLYLCVCNEPEWVNKVQQQALKLLLAALEERQSSRSTSHLASSSSSDEPQGLAELRAALPVLASPHVAQVSCSTTHFKFIVDTLCDAHDGKDRFFSAQVKIKNESKHPFSIAVGQRVTLADTQDRESVDFQILLDKQLVKKGESAILLLSMITKSYAAFNTIQEVIVLHIDEGVKVVVTFVVVNPCVPFFGCGFPSCIAQKVVDSPLGLSYDAPLFLQVLKHLFVVKGGYAMKEVAHLLQGIAHLHGAHNREVLREAIRLKEQLEEECTQNTLLHGFWSSAAGGGAGGGSASSGTGYSGTNSPPLVPGRSSEPSVTGAVRPVPSSLSQPYGYSPGAVAPSSAPSSSSLHHLPNSQTVYPTCLVHASPSLLFALALLWFAEFPVTVVEASILTCDPQTYLETMQPTLQGLVLWIVDISLGLLVRRSENGTNMRSLALTFASMLCPLARSGVANPAELERGVMVRMHVVTALVQWMTTFDHIVSKHAFK